MWCQRAGGGALAATHSPPSLPCYPFHRAQTTFHSHPHIRPIRLHITVDVDAESLVMAAEQRQRHSQWQQDTVVVIRKAPKSGASKGKQQQPRQPGQQHQGDAAAAQAREQGSRRERSAQWGSQHPN